MDLPLQPPFPPMEARSAEEVPDGPGWRFEPKWDGFRCLVFRDGHEVVLAPSRWSTERSTEWEALPPELVVEVVYDHWSGGRFRHGTRLLRFRPDKAPAQCTFDQVPRGARLEEALAFGGR